MTDIGIASRNIYSISRSAYFSAEMAIHLRMKEDIDNHLWKITTAVSLDAMNGPVRIATRSILERAYEAIQHA